jgi:hypothetical protein
MSHWARVRIFGIDAKNRACWEGGTDAAAHEGVGVRYLDNERDHSVKCWDHPGSKTSVSFSSCEASPWVHSTVDSDCTEKNWITEKQNAGREAGTSMKRGESHIKKEKRGDTLRSYAMPPQRVRRPA